MKQLWAMVTALAVAACSSIAEPDRDESAPIQTDRLSYTINQSGRAGFYATPPIELTLTNISGGPAFLTRGARELELVLEGLEDGEWVPKYSGVYADGGTGVLRLEPGEKAVFNTTIEGFLPGICSCAPILNLEDGVYRFRIFQGYVDSFDEELWETGEELPLEFRVSNRFAVDAP